MAVIFPGQEFTVEIGGGKQMQAVALTGKQQRELGECIDKINSAIRAVHIDGKANPLTLVEEYDATRAALACCYDSETADQLLETELDTQLAFELAQAIYFKQAIDADDKKKFESQHSSETDRSADDAEASVTATT